MTYYTDEKQAQIVIQLLKAHGIRHVIASPGATNICFVGSVQTDPFFTVYSAVDERSAAYMACGLAAQLGEPVVISCTGATASRNYLPGLTEAFYRKLPVLALTSTQIQARIGHLVAQVIDRSEMPNDVVKLSVDLPVVKDADDVWEAEIKVNKAILELKRRGGGPVHINLPTVYSENFRLTKLPEYRVIDRWTESDALPPLKGRVGIFVGSHKTWTAEETAAVERFCETNNAVVFCDHTSGYHGKYRVMAALLGGQEGKEKEPLRPDIHIHLGEVSGDYFTHAISGKEVWRVSPDGEIRDTFQKLRHVFEMTEERFFQAYSDKDIKATTYYDSCRTEIDAIRAKLPDLPLSNIWLASQFSQQVPAGSVVHFAILNSLRAWNFFNLPPSVSSASNVGGFGIDGCMSSLVGASLANPDQLFFLVTGDLAFFYDMNALGSRHLGPNVRILLVNNGKGIEFAQHGHRGARYAHGRDEFIAADRHFGRKSPKLVKGYAEALGLDYFAASTKDESVQAMAGLLNPEKRERPMLVEVFVDADDESKALQIIRNIELDASVRRKRVVKDMIGAENIKLAKRLLVR
nr:thiamine pyrophosphate-binding protein [Marinicella sp. W31]MDC2875958.1 thiamine pyrophosphate-binding protein [Marinicella sp. W31]